MIRKFWFYVICMLIFIMGCKPSNEELLREAYALGQQKKYEKAIAVYTRIIKYNDRIQAAYYYRGYMYFQQKSYENALQDFNKVMSLQSSGHFILTLNPDGPFANEESRNQVNYNDALYQRAQVKCYMDSLASSFYDFEMLINNKYEVSNCCIWLGFISTKRGENEKACGYFKTARKLAIAATDKQNAITMIKTYCEGKIQ